MQILIGRVFLAQGTARAKTLWPGHAWCDPGNRKEASVVGWSQQRGVIGEGVREVTLCQPIRSSSAGLCLFPQRNGNYQRVRMSERNRQNR